MQSLNVSCAFRFAATHFLTKYRGKCENLHGHNYKLTVTVQGAVKSDGMVIDFHIIEETVQREVMTELDHSHLNDRFENPTAEHIAIWIWERLNGKLPLVKITLHETEDTYVEYSGER